MTDDLDQSTCMQVLEPHLRAIAGCISDGFAFYQTYPREIRAEHDDRSSAACVHAHVMSRVAGRLDGQPGLALLDVRGLKVLSVEDRLIGRFKKVDDEGRSHSFPTRQATTYEQQRPLPGIPAAATKVTFGYEPDAAFSQIIRLMVACPLGKSVLWASQIDVVGDDVAWTDITPRRLTGTSAYRRFSGSAG